MASTSKVYKANYQGKQAMEWEKIFAKNVDLIEDYCLKDNKNLHNQQ